MYKHILLPTDGSAQSRKAIKEGVALAKALHARITGFHAPASYEVLAYGEYFPPDLITSAQWSEQSKQTSEGYLAAIEKEAKAANVPYQGHFIESMSPWQAIVEAANEEQCDLIFMSSHGRTGISSLLLGSQAAKVLSHSKIPVLVHKTSE